MSANAPVITQVNFGDVEPGQKGSFPSSSCSQPSIVADMLDALDVRPGQSVLEIGTGTGWNAALLSRAVGEHGRVVTIEVDPRLAQDARRALTPAGYHPLVITGDGLDGYSAGAPYDRVICTASIREVVPHAGLDQLRLGDRLVTPWGTDWSNGVMLTLDLAEAERERGLTGIQWCEGTAENVASLPGVAHMSGTVIADAFHWMAREQVLRPARCGDRLGRVRRCAVLASCRNRQTVVARGYRPGPCPLPGFPTRRWSARPCSPSSRLAGSR